MAWLWGRGKVDGNKVAEALVVAAERGTLEDRKRALSQAVEVAGRTGPDGRETLLPAVPALVRMLVLPSNAASASETEMDVLRLALEVLNLLTQSEEESEEASTGGGDGSGPEAWAPLEAQARAAESGAMGGALGLLQLTDFRVRFHAIRFLQHLAKGPQRAALQQACLHPAAAPRLADMLREPREILRNETLLLLLGVCGGHTELQKVVAFGGAFEAVLETVQREGGLRGSIVVADCLQLVLVLLRANPSNAAYFREASLVPRLVPLLRPEASPQAGAFLSGEVQGLILALALQVVRALLGAPAPHAPHVDAAQAALLRDGVTAAVRALAHARLLPSPIRALALRTLADLLRGHAPARATLDDTDLARLLHQALAPAAGAAAAGVAGGVGASASVGAAERAAAAEVFAAYLFENEEAQLRLVRQALPGAAASPEQVARPPPARVLLRALLQEPADELAAYYAALMLGALLQGNTEARRALLAARVEWREDERERERDTPLLEACAGALQRRAGGGLGGLALLRFLLAWSHEAPEVARQLSESRAASLLLEQAAAPADPARVHFQGLAALLLACVYLALEQAQLPEAGPLFSLLTARIGHEPLLSKLDALRKTPAFIDAEQPPASDLQEPLLLLEEPPPAHASALPPQVYDYEFALFFKDLHDGIQRALRRRPSARPARSPAAASSAAASVARACSPVPTPGSGSEAAAAAAAAAAELAAAREELATLHGELVAARAALSEREAEVRVAQERQRAAELEAERAQAEAQRERERAGQLEIQLQATSRTYVELESLLARKEQDIERLRTELTRARAAPLHAPAVPAAASSPTAPEASASAALAEAQVRIAQLESELATLRRSPAPAPGLEELKAQLRDWEARYRSLEQEQEELLVVLARTEIENNNLKERLRLLTEKR